MRLPGKIAAGLGASLLLGAVAAGPDGATLTDTPTTQPAVRPVTTTQPVDPPMASPSVSLGLPPETVVLVDRLVGQLTDPSWLVRQEAHNALVQMGNDVVGYLRRILQQNSNEEIRTRLEACLHQIDENRTTGTSLISLHLKQATPPQIFAELSRQANSPLRTSPPDLWQSRTWPAINVDIDRQPFWSAMRQICSALRLNCQSNGRDMVVVPAENGGRSFADTPCCVSGGFVVSATTISTTCFVDPTLPRNVRRNTTMQFMVYPEPKLSVLQGTMWPRIDEAVDEQGNSLATSGMTSDYMQPVSSWAWNLNTSLAPKPDSGKRIVRLKGTARFLIQSRAATAEVENVTSARDVTRSVAGKVFQLKQVAKEGDVYKVQVALFRSGWNPNDWNYRQILSNFKLLDARGTPLPQAGTEYNGGTNDRFDMTLRFGRQVSIGGVQPGDPVRLVWEVPLELREVSVPFEFTDLPLP